MVIVVNILVDENALLHANGKVRKQETKQKTKTKKRK